MSAQNEVIKHYKISLRYSFFVGSLFKIQSSGEKRDNKSALATPWSSEHIFIPTQFVMEATRGDKRARRGRKVGGGKITCKFHLRSRLGDVKRNWLLGSWLLVTL